MNSEKIQRMEASWRLLAGSQEELAEAFFSRLFELDPRIGDLFAATEMESQKEMFGAMVGELVQLARDPEASESRLRISGQKHRSYGVVGRHYILVGEALLWALDRTLPSGLDPETREAWAEAYTRTSFLMQREGSGRTPTPPPQEAVNDRSPPDSPGT